MATSRKSLVLTNLLLYFLRLSVCQEKTPRNTGVSNKILHTHNVALSEEPIRPYFSNIKFIPGNENIEYSNKENNVQKDMNKTDKNNRIIKPDSKEKLEIFKQRLKKPYAQITNTSNDQVSFAEPLYKTLETQTTERSVSGTLDKLGILAIEDVDSSKEPIDFVVPYETISRFNTKKQKETTSSLQALRNISNFSEQPSKITTMINLKLTDSDDKIDIFFRTKKDVPVRKMPAKRTFAELKKLNNQAKRKEMLDRMAADASSNGTNLDEQQYNKETDAIHILHKHINEKSDDYGSGVNCNFENDCRWTWRKDIANGFFITSGGKLAANESGPRTDANDREFGSFLIIRLPLKSTEFHVKSPLFGPTTPSCKLHMHIYQENMNGGEIRVVGDKTTDRYQALNNHTQWLVDKVHGNNDQKWKKYEMSIGKISSDFTLLLEVSSENIVAGATVAFDNLQLHQCFVKFEDICTPLQYRCRETKECVNSSAICDISEDCAFGDDEKQNCHLIPFGARCNFEEDEWCGWENDDVRILKWTRHNGSTPTNFTGPNYDHTYMNKTGNYLYVNMLTDGSQFASGAVIQSKLFNPPPRVHGNYSSRYYNSCSIRFYFHKTGKHKSGLLVQITELTPAENKSTKLYWNFMDDHGDQWVRHVLILPNITHKYYITFEAKRGYRYISDVAIDDVSLSPECFGLNIPPEDLGGYNYWNPVVDLAPPKETHLDFINKTYYKLTTCQAKGRFGPTQPECQKTYNNTDVSIKVMHEAGLTGVQRWIAPNSTFYTFIIAGASGGKGSSGMGSSRGAMVRTVLDLKKGDEIFILIGQEGNSACPKILGQPVNSSCYGNKNYPGGVRGVLMAEINDSGGGGGGATYVFMRNKTREKVPIAIAAGGGGLGLARWVDGENHQGQAIDLSVKPVEGARWGYKSSGSGGGWTSLPRLLHYATSGLSLLSGGIGGKACYNSSDGRGDGGFGGGGGGCKNGGGGGGYRGGDANTTNGDGGISYLDPTRGVPNLSEAHSGYNAGPGYVIIIPAVKEGCDCMFACVALDERRSKVACVCPGNWNLGEDNKSCISSVLQTDTAYPMWFISILIATIVCLTLAFCTFCFFLYNKYQARHTGMMRRKMIPGPDLQLARLRLPSDHMMTEYNPNYEWAGTVYTVKDLKEIPREQLRLIKALGQGAFGEVYQGFYRQRPCDTVEMPVAVKTLPEMSTNQAEMDFLMEALIMSKFNHPNIVHFIGVCFDKHPRFIVLELLGGGDLKNFLRESRPKPERSSPVTMRDLLLIAVDIAKGCNYLEENRFIHRDIAARNCLLTTKGPGRVVKIADFGMSRDVYRSDYYRKGGKAMLPIKWMPPEAFLDGIFTSKTDVWSFGVLLWEIFKMGFMPYTGCTNREVMDLVVQGGRLEQPENCPGPIYGIMTQCWHPTPEERPTFALILERLGYCTQDPDVMNTKLPTFQKAPSNERDTTIMRPSDSEDILQAIPNPDYLLPNEAIPTTPDVMESTSSVEKLLPDKSDNWETSFILPNSKSTQPLLIDSNRGDEENKNIENPPKTNPVPSQNSIPHNNNFMLRNDATVKSGVALDASALAKSVMGTNSVKKYANINQDSNLTLSNGVVLNRNLNHISKNEGEINV